MKTQKQSATEETVFAIVVTRKGGGLAVSECTVPVSSLTVLKAHPPDAADQAIARVTDAIERRVLR